MSSAVSVFSFFSEFRVSVSVSVSVSVLPSHIVYYVVVNFLVLPTNLAKWPFAKLHNHCKFPLIGSMV